jgi:hypothetical protein
MADRRAQVMASASSLNGVMKWLRRDEWADAFSDLLEDHLRPACSKWDVAIDKLSSIIGDGWFMNLWGCAFEDFLTRELSDNRNIVDDYLKRRSWKESATNKAYIAALRSSVMSLYEVSDITPGESFLARDLIRGGEPIRISEKSATRLLHAWDRIGARVLELGSKVVMGGGVLRFERDVAESLLESIRRAGQAAREKSCEFARQIGRDINDPIIAKTLSEGEMLRLTAPMFTSFWLTDALKTRLDPPAIVVRNSDGEKLLFSTIHYPLKLGTTGNDIRLALSKLPDFRQENDHFWNWLARRQSGRRKSASKIDGPVQTFSTTLDDGSIVLGTVELKENELILEVNSARRAERGRGLLQQVVGGLVREALVETQTLDHVMESKPAKQRQTSSLGLSSEEERKIIHASLDRHYTKMLNQSVPALGNIKPLEAAKTADGREKLVAWLKYLENKSAQHAPDNPMANYDLAWLWKKLGISDLRR